MFHKITDTDIYKFRMWQFFEHNCKEAIARYEFKCRNNVNGRLIGSTKQKSEEIFHDIIKSVASLSDIKITNEEIAYLHTQGFDPNFVESLRDFRYSNELINIDINDSGLAINYEGPLCQVSPLEIPILYIVNESFFRHEENVEDKKYIQNHLIDLEGRMQDISYQFIDFGTRRRESSEFHELAILLAIRLGKIKGTSNVYLAMKHNLPCIGTMAHEFLQAYQVLAPLFRFQHEALSKWLVEWKGRYSVALTDVTGTDSFLKQFDKFLAACYQGARHDSGDPDVWFHKMKNHYEGFNLDPKTKRYVFSNGLNFKSGEELFNRYLEYLIDIAIGTKFTNGFTKNPLNIVAKMTDLNGFPVAKISDDEGKGMCRNNDYINYLKSVS